MPTAMRTAIAKNARRRFMAVRSSARKISIALP
jgi:hypothetical protein